MAIEWNPPSEQDIIDYVNSTSAPPQEFLDSLRGRGLNIVPAGNPPLTVFRKVLPKYQFNAIWSRYQTSFPASDYADLTIYVGDYSDVTRSRRDIEEYLHAKGISSIVHLSRTEGIYEWIAMPIEYLSVAPVDTSAQSEVFRNVFITRIIYHVAGSTEHCYSYKGIIWDVLKFLTRDLGISLSENCFTITNSMSYEEVTESISKPSYINVSQVILPYEHGFIAPNLTSVDRVYAGIISATYLVCPEAIGLDPSTLEFIGDPRWLDNPVIYGFIDYVHRGLPNAAGSREYLSSTIESRNKMYERHAKAHGLTYVRDACLNKIGYALSNKVLQVRVQECLVSTLGCPCENVPKSSAYTVAGKLLVGAESISAFLGLETVEDRVELLDRLSRESGSTSLAGLYRSISNLQQQASQAAPV